MSPISDRYTESKEAYDSSAFEEMVVRIAELQHKVDRDRLTGLLSRDAFMDKVAKERTDHYGLLFIDLTNYKLINDRINHETGDEVLRGIAMVLRKSDLDSIARLGGDEFVVGVDLTARDGKQANMSDEDRLKLVEQRVDDTALPYCELIGSVFNVPEFRIAIGGSILHPDQNIQDALNSAEEAMKTNKADQHIQLGQYRK